MPSQPNPLADQLLGRLPDPSQIAQYREQVEHSLRREQRRLQFQRISTYAFWIFCAVSATAWIWLSAAAANIPRGPIAAGILLLCGGIEVIKHSVSAGRFEVLKEIKQLQLQVFELEQQVRSRPSSQSW